MLRLSADCAQEHKSVRLQSQDEDMRWKLLSAEGGSTILTIFFIDEVTIFGVVYVLPMSFLLEHIIAVVVLCQVPSLSDYSRGLDGGVEVIFSGYLPQSVVLFGFFDCYRIRGYEKYVVLCLVPYSCRNNTVDDGTPDQSLRKNP